MEHLRGVAERDVDRHELRGRAVLGVGRARVRGRLDEEVQERRIAAPARDEHVAAGTEAGQQRLDRKRGQHCRDGGVDGVAALAEHARASLRRRRVPRGDYALCDLSHC